MYYFGRAGLDASYLTATPRPNGHVYLVVNVAEGFTKDSPLRGEAFLRQFTEARLIRVFPNPTTGPLDARSAELYVLL